MDKISLVIPVYNTEKYLNRCFESIRNQTYSNIEIIFVNDKSPDNCKILLEKFHDSDDRVKVIEHKVNKGLSESRNTGINHATGQFIMFIDSDDYIDLKTCELLLRISKKEKLDLLMFQYNLIGWSKENNSYFSNELKVYRDYLNKSILPQVIGPTPEEMGKEKKIGYAACSYFIKKDIITNHHIKYFDEKELLYEDYLFALHLIPNLARVGVLDSGLYYYCCNEGSLTNDFKLDNIKKLASFIEFIWENIEFIKMSDDNKTRFFTTMLNYLRTLIIQSSKQNVSVNLLRESLSNEIIQRLLNDYPLNRLPYKYSIFFKLIKRNNVFKLYILKLLLELWNLRG